MKYMGSKKRIAKYILPIMLEHRTPNQWWVEPFVGGGNVIDKVDGLRLGSDSNKWAIQALLSVRDHADELPKNNREFTEEDYSKLKVSDDYAHKGFAGFAYSFGAKWLGSWARASDGEDFVKEAFHNAKKQQTRLHGVTLINCDYRQLRIPPNSLIYCDPPYCNTTKYKKMDLFNHDIFWQWCRDNRNQGHTVFVSEYSAPDDFKCIYEREQVSGLTVNGKQKTAAERLFTL